MPAPEVALSGDVARDLDSWGAGIEPAARSWESVAERGAAAFEGAPATRMLEDALTFQVRMMECWDAWWRASLEYWAAPFTGPGRR